MLLGLFDIGMGAEENPELATSSGLFIVVFGGEPGNLLGQLLGESLAVRRGGESDFGLQGEGGKAFFRLGGSGNFSPGPLPNFTPLRRP